MVALTIAQDTDAERLSALREYRILDTGPDDSFQRIADFACVLLGTRSSAISFVDAQRCWKKASVDWVIQNAPRDVAMSNYIVEHRIVALVRQ